uniref:Uncharacterized protein LOC111135527 n=1 Tax=Crassostrea virginica TaxID=6565 RepID=A0A8B8EN88_CRAVI|nr:uncharacterized protein LOC111135527 [Crassostrea virginica]
MYNSNMAWTNSFYLIFISQLTHFKGTLSLTCKTYYSSNSSLFYYEYCSIGCCGTERSFKCCASENTGAIVGGVVGAVLFFLFVGAVSFICWQNSKKKKNTNIDVEPEIDELGYELEVMGEMSPYPTERDNFRSPLSPSHLQGDFRHHPGVTDTETFPGQYGHPPPEYSEDIPPMSPPPTYREREATQLSNDERY